MIICNVDHLDDGLVSLSQQASSHFLTGGAAFHEMLAALETQQLKNAASAAKKALGSFDGAVRSFSKLANTIQSEEFHWITYAIREIDFDNAARTVHLSPDSAIIKNLNSALVSGNLQGLIVMFSQQIADVATKLKAFAGRASGPNVVLDDEYRLAHELLRDWGVMITEGQYISSVCVAAATEKAVH